VSRISHVLIRALSVVLLLGLTVGVAPANAAEPGPLRVLLTGDSLVQGFHGDYTWRYRLYKELVRQGVSVNFVGSLSQPIVKPGYASAQYLDPNFDRDHFAIGGTTLRLLMAKIGAEVSSQQPDIIVLGGGINDLRNGASPEEVDSRLDHSGPRGEGQCADGDLARARRDRPGSSMAQREGPGVQCDGQGHRRPDDDQRVTDHVGGHHQGVVGDLAHG
jgi:hypothetical protein